MIFKNIISIFHRNYSSLTNEVAVRNRWKKPVIGLTFIIIPGVIGIILGIISPIWDSLVVGIASVVSVLTGFSLNAIVLMMGHEEEQSYDLESRIVDQTEDYTLYSLMIGISILVVLIIGVISVNSSIEIGINGLRLYSIIIYSLIVHYFIGLFVVVHRLFSLVKGGAIHS